MSKAVEFTVRTTGRRAYDITPQVQDAVAASGAAVGICLVFVHHTSASLLVCENADPKVLSDVETWLAGAVVDGDPRFRHRDEGDDDMSAHVRSILTGSSLTLPVRGGRCDLGTWQGLYLYEHRRAPHARRISVTVVG